MERLKELLPKEQFSQAIQARSLGRIIARETIPAMKKELGNFGKNGGDRTRKMKLWKKQQRGKERLQSTARVESLAGGLPGDIEKVTAPSAVTFADDDKHQRYLRTRTPGFFYLQF